MAELAAGFGLALLLGVAWVGLLSIAFGVALRVRRRREGKRK